GELGAGAYLGVPVRGPGGESFGALCVVDRDRHAWTLEDERTLVGLAATLVSELELRAIRRATRPGTH
ncbi:MAG: GAF domain-containing protein, partial [Polyangiaceae bacterium]